MSVQQGLGRSALLLNDMQKAGLDRPHDPEHTGKIRASGFIENAVRMVASARDLSVPVIWVRAVRRDDRADVPQNSVDEPGGWHLPWVISPTSREAEQIDECPVLPADQVVTKPRFDPFIGTDLDLQLRARNVETLLVGGYSTNVGVESAARTAHDLGYDVVVLSDCCFNVKVDMHEFALTRILPRFARIMTSDEALAHLKPLDHHER